MINQTKIESPQPVTEAESLVGAASTALFAVAMKDSAGRFYYLSAGDGSYFTSTSIPAHANTYNTQKEAETAIKQSRKQAIFSQQTMTVIPYPLLRAWRIDPAGETGIDTLYVLDDGRWDTVMEHVEYSLEQQTKSADGGGKMERPWGEMKVTITGELLTPEEWAEICG